MASRRGHRRWAVARTTGFSLWLAVVASFLLWQAARYRGIMSLVGEWQFNAFGRQYPTFNYVLLVFLLCLPGYLLFLRPRERGADERPGAALLRSARTFLKAIFGAAAGLAATTLIILVAMLFLPRSSGEVQRIDLGRATPTVVREGPAVVSGAILYQRTAGFDVDVLLAQRTFRFAPIVGPRDDPEDVRFFVQLAPVDDRTRGGVASMSGVLKRNGLPGEIVRLFRYAGFNLEEPHYVLFAEPAAMRWPYLSAMVQVAIGAGLALVVGLLQRRRVVRIDRGVHAPASAQTAEARPAA